MRNIFIINGGQVYAQAKGNFNKAVTEKTILFFKQKNAIEIKVTNINKPYDIQEEIKKFIWADLIVYHSPIWWFQLPNGLKKYFDEVLNSGKNKGLWAGDGRSSINANINYGTGGLLMDRHYIVTTSWNAPSTAFTFPNEFFQEISVDNGVLYGFHKMNEFLGLKLLGSFHFYDIIKNGKIDLNLNLYTKYLQSIIKE